MNNIAYTIVGATAAVVISAGGAGAAWADPAQPVSGPGLAFPHAEYALPDGEAAAEPVSDETSVDPVDQPLSQDEKVNAALGVAAMKFGLASGAGAATGALVGGVAGCAIGATTMAPLFLPGMAGGCLAGAAAGAGLGSLAGTVIVGVPVGVAAGVEAWNKLNAPTPASPAVPEAPKM